jgi:hypothetical protein
MRWSTNCMRGRFRSLTVPCVAVYLAVKEPLNAANRDRGSVTGRICWRC